MEYVGDLAADATGVYLWGMTEAYDGGWRDAVLVKWDANGTFAFNKTWATYHTNDWARSIWINGSSIYTTLYIDPVNDITLIKWGSNGSVTWTRTRTGLSGGLMWCDGSRIHVIGNTAATWMYLCAWDETGYKMWDMESFTMSCYSIWGGAGAIYTHGSRFSKWTMPSISHPADITYVHSTPGHNITWTITDASTSTTSYVVLCNGSSAGSGSWASGTPFNITIDGLAVGRYNYTISAADGLGGIIDDTVLVRVTNVPPSVVGPADMTFDHATPGHNITWIVTDPSNGTTGYDVFKNGLPDGSGSWTSGVPIVYYINGLPVGLYNYTIVVSDGLGGFAQDSVNVTVLNVPPAITSSPNSTYVRGSIGNQITWTITDASNGTTFYIVYQNGSQNSTGNWTSGTPVVASIDGRAMGSYNFTIVATDGLGGSVQDQVIVTVLNAPPACTHPANVTYPHASAGHAINWTVTDTDTMARNFVIMLDGASNGTGTWTSGVQISWSVAGLSMGSYNFTLIASDGLGGIVQDDVTVSVINAMPRVTAPADLTYVQGHSGNQLSWSISDASTASCTYTISRSGITVASGAWIPGSPVAVQIDGLAPGTYTYTIVVSDGLGGSTSDSVLVTVKEGVLGIEMGTFLIFVAAVAGIVVVVVAAAVVSRQRKKRAPPA
jgi:hypothetical protein